MSLCNATAFLNSSLLHDNSTKWLLVLYGRSLITVSAYFDLAYIHCFGVWSLNSSFCLSTKLRLSDCKSCQSFINVSSVSYKSYTLLWYVKKSIYRKYHVYFHKKSFFQVYLLWMPKLECPKSVSCCPKGPKISPSKNHAQKLNRNHRDTNTNQ